MTLEEIEPFKAWSIWPDAALREAARMLHCALEYGVGIMSPPTITYGSRGPQNGGKGNILQQVNRFTFCDAETPRDPDPTLVYQLLCAALVSERILGRRKGPQSRRDAIEFARNLSAVARMQPNVSFAKHPGATHLSKVWAFTHRFPENFP